MRRWLTVLSLVLWPEAASAHGAVPGIEGFYQGLVHPFVEIGEVLAVIVIGFIIGRHDKAVRGNAWPAYLGALILGMLAGLLVPRPEQISLVPWALGLVGGVIVAIHRKLPHRLLYAIAITAGALAGLVATPDGGEWRDIAFTAAGGLTGLLLALFYAIAAAIWIDRHRRWPWLQIGLRILGSWIAAICVLMLALAIAPSGT